jgi:hypothetical protein
MTVPTFHAELGALVVLSALPTALVRQKDNVLRTARRTSHAIRPALRSKVVQAIVGIGEVDDCIFERLRFVGGFNGSPNTPVSQAIYCLRQDIPTAGFSDSGYRRIPYPARRS